MSNNLQSDIVKCGCFNIRLFLTVSCVPSLTQHSTTLLRISETQLLLCVLASVSGWSSIKKVHAMSCTKSRNLTVGVAQSLAMIIYYDFLRRPKLLKHFLPQNDLHSMLLFELHIWEHFYSPSCWKIPYCTGVYGSNHLWVCYTPMHSNLWHVMRYIAILSNLAMVGSWY